MTGKGVPWSPEDLKKLEALVIQHGKRWATIARLTGRTAYACEWRYNIMKRKSKSRSTSAGEIVARPAPLSHQSLTAAICGDPPPGRSALDKRASQEQFRAISLGGAR